MYFILYRASQKAESVLTEVTEKATEAEVVKNQVQIVKEKAEALVAKIAEEKAYAEEKLEAAKPALEEAEAALNTIKPAHIATVRLIFFFHLYYFQFAEQYIYVHCVLGAKTWTASTSNHADYGLCVDIFPT